MYEQRPLCNQLFLLAILPMFSCLAFAGDVSSASADANSLLQPLPADRKLIDSEAVLIRRIKAEPTSLNPILMFTAVDAEFDYLLWDRPFVLNSKLEWVLNSAVAESYRESEDRLQGVLKLRPGLRWHDGEPFTAADVAYSWAKITDDRVACRKSRTGADQLSACEEVDSLTVRFIFKKALPTNKWNIDFPIIPRHIYRELEKNDPTLEADGKSVYANRHPVGSGPFRFESWESGERIVLRRWDEYAGSVPAFSKIIFKVVPDNNAALAGFETGELDETELTPQQFALETGGQKFKGRGVTGRADRWSTYYIGWNVDGSVPFLSDTRVRRAMSYAFNQQAVIDRVFFGLFTPSRGLFHSRSWVGDSGIEPYEYNPKMAAQLLDEAGWLVDNEDGWRYKIVIDKQGKQVRIRAGFQLNLVHGSQTSPRLADLFRDDLKRVGVELKTRILEWSVFNQRTFGHEFEAYLSAWTSGPEPDDAWNLFHSDSREGGRNYTGYSNPEVDKLFELGRASFSDSVRREAYQKINRIIYADAPYTFLVNAPSLWAFNRDLRGIEYSPRGPICFYPGVLGWWKPAKP